MPGLFSDSNVFKQADVLGTGDRTVYQTLCGSENLPEKGLLHTEV